MCDEVHFAALQEDIVTVSRSTVSRRSHDLHAYGARKVLLRSWQTNLHRLFHAFATGMQVTSFGGKPICSISSHATRSARKNQIVHCSTHRWMYADREPRVSRHVQIEYKSNAAEFGMGNQRHRSRSPFRRAVTRSGQPLLLRLCYCPLRPIQQRRTAYSADGAGEIEVARRVYVGNLAYSVAWQDLKDHFKPIGQGIQGGLQQ